MVTKRHVAVATSTTLVLLALLVMGVCECDDWEYKLIRSILSDYDSSIRPSLRHNMTLNVTFGLALAQIIDVVRV